MNEQYYQTLKSAETEDWLDFHVIRPFCFQLARLFARFDIHPNTVTIASMFIGVASCWFFAQGSFYYQGVMGVIYNLIAIFLLMWADFFDCTDGQLARRAMWGAFLTALQDSFGSFPSITLWYGASISIMRSNSHGWGSAIRPRTP